MKLHRNAKTTPAMRALIVHRIRQEQRPAAEVAAAAGVSVRTTYKWLRRHRLGGRPALEDASSRPHRQPRRTAPATVAAIVAARHERHTAWAIATRLHVPRSTVAAVLVRVGLNRLARLVPSPPVRRYEQTRPGELVHLDTKPLGRILRVGTGSIRTSAAAWAPAGSTCTSRSMITVGPRMSKSCRTKPAQRPRPSYGAPSAGLLGAGSPCRACSPTMGAATSAAAFGRPPLGAACDSRGRVPIGPRPTAKRNDSFRPSFAAGPTRCRIPARGGGRGRSVRGCATTTSSAHTLHSVINHRASAFRGSPSEQPCHKSSASPWRCRRAALRSAPARRPFRCTPRNAPSPRRRTPRRRTRPWR